ncbi:MAG: hypothetical protein A2516_08150 [Alphaproteobacteria bacterium RIFOXYD12_FULL_60_8]|nr:MAG: hypothetical protein A2516_08150 [Alphaproteobacteria bacterium RIFOXYD12_FULL_60_8]
MTVRSCLSRHLSARRTPEKVKADGWHEMGVLVINVADERLTDWERQFAENLGTRLYGKREDAE